MSDYQKTLWGEYGRNDFIYSLGFMTGTDNTISSVMWNGLAFQQGLAIGMQVIAVNGEAVTAANLAAAVTAAKGTDEKIELIVLDGTRYRTVTFDYHDGLKYPHLERIEGTPDRLGDLFTARRR